MDLGAVHGIITLVTSATFGGICWWAYRSGNKERFEQDALLPFLDEPSDGAGANASRAGVEGERDE
jgi:cytochrome c oxidase cbb3-type subunit 4